jgi:gas vesicle protein
MKKFGSFLCGTLTGAFFGCLIALLLTPITGKAMRARICNSFTNIRNEVQEATSTRSADLRQELANLQNKKTI